MKSDSPLASLLLGAAIAFVLFVLFGLTAWIVVGKSLFRPQAAPAAPLANVTLPSLTPSATATALPSVTFPPSPSPFQPRRSPTAREATPGPPTHNPTLPPAKTQKPGASPSPWGTSATAMPLPSPTPLSVTYIVQPGDSLYQIATRFAVDPLDLMVANHIPNPALIQPGQVFIIPGPGAVPTDQLSGPKSILVDIAQQHLYAYQGNSLVYSFTVSSGVFDGTLRGNFEILDKLPYPYSDTWDFWMPYWLGIYYAGGLENGFHGLPVMPGGTTLWGDTLGTPASYGCVVLGSLEAKVLYDWAELGTPVTIR